MLASPLSAVATDVVVPAVVAAVAVHGRAEAQLLVVTGEPGPAETEIFMSRWKMAGVDGKSYQVS